MTQDTQTFPLKEQTASRPKPYRYTLTFEARRNWGVVTRPCPTEGELRAYLQRVKKHRHIPAFTNPNTAPAPSFHSDCYPVAAPNHIQIHVWKDGRVGDQKQCVFSTQLNAEVLKLEAQFQSVSFVHQGTLPGLETCLHAEEAYLYFLIKPKTTAKFSMPFETLLPFTPQGLRCRLNSIPKTEHRLNTLISAIDYIEQVDRVDRTATLNLQTPSPESECDLMTIWLMKDGKARELI